MRFITQYNLCYKIIEKYYKSFLASSEETGELQHVFQGSRNLDMDEALRVIYEID